MSKFVTSPVRLAIAVGVLILLGAGIMQATSALNDNLRTAEVVSTSVSFDSAGAAEATVAVSGGVSAQAETDSVPGIGQTVLLKQGGEQWEIHSLGEIGAYLFFPFTEGILLLVSLLCVVAAAGLAGELRKSAAAGRGDVRHESPEPAEESEETSSAATHTS